MKFKIGDEVIVTNPFAHNPPLPLQKNWIWLIDYISPDRKYINLSSKKEIYPDNKISVKPDEIMKASMFIDL